MIEASLNKVALQTIKWYITVIRKLVLVYTIHQELGW